MMAVCSSLSEAVRPNAQKLHFLAGGDSEILPPP